MLLIVDKGLNRKLKLHGAIMRNVKDMKFNRQGHILEVYIYKAYWWKSQSTKLFRKL